MTVSSQANGRPEESPPTHLTLLGVPRITESRENRYRQVSSRHGIALLALLAEADERGLSRERLTGMLWPDSETPQARNSLKQLQFTLRRSLGPPLFEQHGTALGLSRSALSCDLWEFEAAIRAKDWEAAAARYTGPFLDGFTISGLAELELWIDQQRMRLARTYRNACETLGATALKAGDHGVSLDWWRRACAADPLCSRSALGLMQALMAGGDRNGALEFAQAYGDRVREELGATIDPDVADLVRRYQQAERAAPSAVRIVPGQASHSPSLSEPQAQAEKSPPAEAPSPPHGRGRQPLASPWILTVMASAIVAVTGAAVIRWNQPPVVAAASVDGTPVAVFPFTVTGDRDQRHLADAVMELLSQNLDDAGDLRSIPPGVLRGVTGKVGEAVGTGGYSAAAGPRLRAALHVAGRVVATGTGLRLTASMYAAGQQGIKVASALVEGDPSHLVELVERLAAQLLVERYSRGVRRGSHTPYATPPFRAVKAFLGAEEMLRQDRPGPALEAYTTAIGIDSSFAPAHAGRARAANALGRRAEALAAAGRALELCGKLPGRDSAMIAALHATLEGRPESAERLYREVLADDSADLEAWTRLGELLFVLDPLRGHSAAPARTALGQAVALDSSNLDALLPLTRLASLDPYPEAGASLNRRLVAALSRSPRAVLRALRNVSLDDRSGPGQVTRILLPESAHIPPALLFDVAKSVGDLRAINTLAGFLVDPDQPLAVRAYGRRLLAQVAVAKGRWPDALVHARILAGLDPAQGLEMQGLIVTLPFLPGMPRAEVERVRQAFEGWHPGEHAGDDAVSRAVLEGHHLLRLYYLGLLSARLGEESRALGLADALERSPVPVAPALPGVLGASVRARVAAEAGRAAEALRLLEATDWAAVAELTVAEASDRFLRADLLRETGRVTEARRWFGGLGLRATYEVIYLGAAAERLAVISEELGLEEDARRLRERQARLQR